MNELTINEDGGGLTDEHIKKYIYKHTHRLINRYVII